MLPDWLLSRATVITLAVLGGLVAAGASVLEARLGERRARLINRLGYTLTAISITLFIVVGFRGPA